MKTYKQKDILTLAKRVNNPRRSYLLVNPLQGKHIPVSPTKAFEMMDTLCEKIREKIDPDESVLVIGFAETATAIALQIAQNLKGKTFYIQTTRESVPSVTSWITFSEEHSHATEQKLAGDLLPEFASQADTVLFVDDEFTTGKTLMNMIRVLEQNIPALKDKQKIAASIICRLSEENRNRWTDAGIESFSLLSLSEDTFEDDVQAYAVSLALPLEKQEDPAKSNELIRTAITINVPVADPRKGFTIDEVYRTKTTARNQQILSDLLRRLDPKTERIVILGSEEYMHQALSIGQALEKALPKATIFMHAITRSPIGICSDTGYPIQSGLQLASLYDPQRTTFLYNIQPCDALIAVSDADPINEAALQDLYRAFGVKRCRQFVCIQEVHNVFDV